MTKMFIVIDKARGKDKTYRIYEISFLYYESIKRELKDKIQYCTKSLDRVRAPRVVGGTKRKFFFSIYPLAKRSTKGGEAASCGVKQGGKSM